MLILENLHWADQGSLDLLRRLGRSAASNRVLVLATYREDEVTRRDPLFQLIPTLVRESGAVRIELRGWTAGEIQSLLANRYGLTEANRARLVRYLSERAAQHDATIRQLTALDPLIEQSVTLFERFARILRARDRADLEPWLQAAKRSGVAELVEFAKRLRQDYEAVEAAWTLEWSQGQVEGQVT